MTTSFDIIVIGGGPGGYPAAIRAAQLGKKVALIEAKELGGTCLNRGCIPSKSLISDGATVQKIKHADKAGIEIKEWSFNYSKMAAKKDSVVKQMKTGLEGLIKANNITVFQGRGELVSKNEVRVQSDTPVILTASRIILATGSEPREIKAFPFDGVKIHDSTSFLNLTTLPKSLAVIGGGVIGCEFASLHNSLGVEVTILELLPRILPMEAENVSAALSKSFKKRGIAIEAGVKVEKIEKTTDGITVYCEGGKQVHAEIALISVGRQLNTANIGLEKAGVKVGDNGIIVVDEKMETTVKGIYAVGDISSKWWLAHVASHQGIVAANNACGILSHMHYNAIPSVTFTQPEIATVGLSLEEARKQGKNAVSGAFPFAALGKSQAILETEGFAETVIDKDTGEIYGAQVVGYDASSLIAEMTLAIQNELTVESVTETIHAHPTLPEAWPEALLMAQGTPLHLPPKKRSIS